MLKQIVNVKKKWKENNAVLDTFILGFWNVMSEKYVSKLNNEKHRDSDNDSSNFRTIKWYEIKYND